MRTRSRRPGSLVRKIRVVVMACGLLGALAGCRTQDWPRWGWPRGVTIQGNDMLGLWNSAVVAAFVVGIITWGLILFSAFRYRKRSDEPPPQVAYNFPIETLYTIMPFLIVAVLFFYTAISENFVNKVSRNPDVRVDVTAFQWNWKFAYPNERDQSGQIVQTAGSTEEIPVLVLPVDKTVLFVERSEDVIHSFWVPEFLFKRDVIPGRVNEFQVTITRRGAFVGRCAELCGTYHSMMNFEVRAVSDGDFQAYLAARRRGQTTAQALRAIGQPPNATTTHPFTVRTS